MKEISLCLLDGQYSVCKLSKWPQVELTNLDAKQIFSLTRKEAEISLVCPSELVPAEAKIEAGWRAFVVMERLDFSLVGVLASLSKALAKASVSVFAISTYDTDILLVKNKDIDTAILALSEVARVHN